MKSIFLKVCLIFFFASAGLIYAQVHYVDLNEDEANLVESGSFSIVVSEGDSIIFVAKYGEFAIRIKDAYLFLDLDDDDPDLEFNVTSSSSGTYVVSISSDIDGSFTNVYEVFSIGTREWPDAPPKIIIRVH